MPAMHIPIPAPHRAKRRSKIGSHRIQNRFPESQPARAIANERGKNVPFAERQPHSNAQRFLAPAQEDAAMYLAPAVQARHLVVHQPGQYHEPEPLQELIAKSRGSRLLILSFQSLQHPAYISCPCHSTQSDLIARKPHFRKTTPCARARFWQTCPVAMAAAWSA
jgi:hypothetical protein